MRIYRIFFLLTLVAFIGCNDENGENRNTTKPITLSRTDEQVSVNFNAFAWDLFGALSEIYAEENTCVLSPLSAELALSLIANGADGKALDEITTTLTKKYDVTIDEINTYNRKLTSELAGVSPTATFSSGNSVWAIPQRSFSSTFTDLLSKYYNSGTFNVKEAEMSEKVNSWVEDKTNGLIRNVLNYGDSFEVLLINALYFKDEWAIKFDKSHTKSDTFYFADDNIHSVPFMNEQDDYYVYGNETYNAIKMPFADGCFALYVFLPEAGNTPADVICDIVKSGQNCPEKWDVAFEKRTVNLKIPKFNIKGRMMLTDALKRLGIGQIFSGSEACLHKMFGDPDTAISCIMQSNSFAIDENGGEAASSTFSGLYTDLPPDPSTLVNFIVNRPFIFALTERRSNSILFIGQVNKL